MILIQHLLKIIDFTVALGPLRLRDKVMNANDEHVFILGAIENSDITNGRNRFVDAPEEIVGLFFGRGYLERGDMASLRINTGHLVANRAVFSGRIQPLQDDEESVRPLSIK